MIAKFFKRNGVRRSEESHPALARLTQLGTRSALCTVVRTADGHDARDEVGSVSLYRRQNRLFTQGQALYLAHPRDCDPNRVPFSGPGAILNLQFRHEAVPYSLDCQLVQRVRFSDRLLGRLDPRVPVGYKLTPMGNVVKKQSRGSLRFAHIRGARGLQAFPNVRFDLLVERIRSDGPAHEQAPEVIRFPGDDPVPDEVRCCESSEDMAALFYRTLQANPSHLQQVHLTRFERDTRKGSTEFLDLGYTPVLGLGGEHKGLHLHLRCPRPSDPKDRRAPGRPQEGDVMVLRYVGRNLLDGRDIHYRWGCRVLRCGIETLVLRPRGTILRQTGLPVVLRDFSVDGVGIQNSPILEDYLLGDEEAPKDPEALLKRLKGTGLLLHFHPRLLFPKDLACYRPRVPAAFSVLGEIVRGHIDAGKDAGHLVDLGLTFRYDSADYDADTFDVTAWEPLRGVRENPHFKEIHRALNALHAYLER